MNKIIVSVVLAISLVLIINKVADKIFYTEKPENSAYTVVDSLSTSSESVTKTESENSEIESISALFASTSSADGAVIFKKCAACHSIAKGGGNKIGPALWGTLGRKAGTVPDAKVSPEGLFFKVPYLAIDVPFPTLTITNKVGSTVVKLGAVEVNKTKTKNYN